MSSILPCIIGGCAGLLASLAGADFGQTVVAIVGACAVVAHPYYVRRNR